eukprot:CAMPEP_0197421448 /NCGR_PEP_ID=MMETSP1170-20131217/7415_1 /TAXON_ID=54406 /ORGANISM="Sarcinochrysis sp, Strain CCMP770" /LENGTH=254 /DNA_ID=CAMNT_0042948685 /DNA_START=136 /DNA_END=900 /DNA_ORIENTATION=+
MMILVGVGCGLAAIAALMLHVVFRPVAKPLSAADLERAGVKGVISETKPLSAVDRNAIKDAFLAGPDFKWLAGGSASSDEVHRQVTHYMIECVLRYGKQYGTVLTIRDDDDNALLGSLCLVPPYKSNLLRKAHFLRSVLSLGTPEPYRLGKGCKARFDAFTGGTEAAHHEAVHNRPHWYVGCLGVADCAQGKGVGKRLIEAAIKISAGAPLYLECHDGNVPFYEHRGFKREKQIQLVPEGLDDEFPYNAMVHWG